MKKIINIILAICTLFMLGACGNATEIKAYTAEEKAQIADKIVNDNLGDMVLETSYEEGIYYVVFTFDGATAGYGSSEFYELCATVDEFSITLEKAGIDNVLIFVSDWSNDVPLYITYNGNDITNMYYN